MWSRPLLGVEKFVVCLAPIFVGVGLLFNDIALIRAPLLAIGVGMAVGRMCHVAATRPQKLEQIIDVEEKAVLQLDTVNNEVAIVCNDKYGTIVSELHEVLSTVFDKRELAYAKYVSAVDETYGEIRTNLYKIDNMQNKKKIQKLKVINEDYYRQLEQLKTSLYELRDGDIEKREDLSELLSQLVESTKLYERKDTSV